MPDSDADDAPATAMDARVAQASSWFDGLSDRLRETASAVTDRMDKLDDELDKFARRALGDDEDETLEGGDDEYHEDDVTSRVDVERSEFTTDEVDALRQALAIAKEELRARDARATDAESEAKKMREAAMRAAKELAKEKRVRGELERALEAREEDGEGDAKGGDAEDAEAKANADAESKRVMEEALARANELERALKEAETHRATTSAALEALKTESGDERVKMRAEIDALEEKLAARPAEEPSTTAKQTGGGRGGKKGKKGGRGGRGGGGGDGEASSSETSKADEEAKALRGELESVVAERDALRRARLEQARAAETASKEHADALDDARTQAQMARDELETVRKECEELRERSTRAEEALEQSSRERVEELERVRSEVVRAQDSAGEDAAQLEEAKSRANDAEARVKALEEDASRAAETEATLRADVARAEERSKQFESELASLRDELTDAIAAKEDAEGAVSRGAVNAANANAKMLAAEKAKAKAEAEAEEIRKQLELMDATGREAASSIAAREKAELAQQRAEARLALAEKEAEESRAHSDKAFREGEERKRRFAHVQSQFQVTEKELREKLETLETEVKALRANAEEAEKMKAEAVSIVEETNADAEETKATLAATTAKVEKLEHALETAVSEASEARTKLGVVEEMLALKKNQPDPEPARRASMKSMFTQTVEEAKPRDVASSSTGDARERLLAIMRRLRVSSDTDEKSASKSAKEEQAGLGMLMGMFMGGEDDDETASQSPAPKRDSEDIDALFDRFEAWANANAKDTDAAAPSTSDDASKDDEIKRLTSELETLKSDAASRSTASLAAVNRRAQEAELAAADAKAKLVPLEKANRELAWQISMLAEQDETKTRPVLAQSGWFARAVTGCTAPRRPRSVLLQSDSTARTDATR